MKKYVKKQIKAIMEKFGNELFLIKRRFVLNWCKFKRWFKENWVSVALDLAVAIVAAFVGLIIGGFIALVLVINALLGA